MKMTIEENTTSCYDLSVPIKRTKIIETRRL